jgi:hypothetical protein
MKLQNTVLFLTVLLGHIAMGTGHKWSWVTCESLDANAKFSIEFLGHPVEPRTLKATFKSQSGKTLLEWNDPINGRAERGFIKIAQDQIVGPYTRLTTTIAGYHPETKVNEPFNVTYRQFTHSTWQSHVDLVTYELSCKSPY